MGLAEENREENIIEKDGGELEVPAGADEKDAEVLPAEGAEAENDLVPEDGVSPEEEENPEDGDAEEDAANTNPPMRSALRTLIGIYLVYLGYSILKPVVKNEPVGMPLWVAILFGALFIVAGGCFILMQLKNFKNR